MAENVEVKARLKLDNQASRELDNVRSGFEEVDDAQDEVASGMKQWASQFTAMAAAQNFVPMIRGMKDMATSFFDSANEAYNTQQAFAGMISVMQGKPWADARADAEALFARLQDTAIGIGQDINEVTNGFKLLNNVMGASEEQLGKNEKVMSDLTVIANVMGMNVEQAASELGGMALGSIRVRGQLTQMLAQTGVFGEDLTKAATTFRKMGTEAAFEKISGALNQLANGMREAEPTFDDLKNSITGMMKVMQEQVGAPIVRALIPVLKDLKEKVLGSRDAIERWANTLGKDVSKWATEAVSMAEDAFEYLRTHGEELKNDILEAMRTVKSVVDFIIQHKEEIAIAFGAKMAAPMLAGGAGMMAAGVGGARAAAAGGTAAAAGGFGRAAAGAVGPTQALTAALISWGIAASQGSALMEETGATWYETAAILVNPILAAHHISEKAEKSADARAKAEAALREAMEGNVDAAENLIAQLEKMGEVGRQQAAQVRAQVEAQVTSTRELQAAIEFAAAGADIQPLIEAYNLARESGNEAMMRLAANTIASNDVFTQALIQSEKDIPGGLTGFAQNISKEAKNFHAIMMAVGPLAVGGGQKMRAQEALKKAREKITAKAGVSIKNAKFEIQQDFRDQDPDRVAVVFQRDMVRAAVRRVQTGRATVFGF